MGKNTITSVVNRPDVPVIGAHQAGRSVWAELFQLLIFGLFDLIFVSAVLGRDQLFVLTIAVVTSLLVAASLLALFNDCRAWKKRQISQQ